MFRKALLASSIFSPKKVSTLCRSCNWIPECVKAVQIGTDDIKLWEFCLKFRIWEAYNLQKVGVLRAKHQLLARNLYVLEMGLPLLFSPAHWTFQQLEK